MSRWSNTRMSGLAGAWLVCLAAGGPTAADGWQIQSAFSASTPVLGGGGLALVNKLNTAFDGTVTFGLNEPGVLASAAEAIPAVAAGTVQAAWTTAGFEQDQNSALTFFAGVPFGAEGFRQFDWIAKGPGKALMEELMGDIGVVAIACGYVGPEAGGWFDDPVSTPSDFDGLKIRFFGFGADVLQKLGANTVLLAGGNISSAFTNGQIEAWEFSTPYVDRSQGFEALVDNYYYPSWHQPSSTMILAINPTAWSNLSGNEQNLIRTTCAENAQEMFMQDADLTGPALTAIADAGVTITPFSASIQNATAAAWKQVAAEQANLNPDFKRVYKAYLRFLTPADFLGPVLNILLSD